MAKRRPRHTACLALGSSLGDRAALIRAALEKLTQRGVTIVAVSRLIETQPVGGPRGQRKYLNGAAWVTTWRSPRGLLNLLLAVERELGRTRVPARRNLPRTVDLDLLLYDEAVIRQEGLVVPHPRMHARRFVLKPLAEIAPDLKHPVLQRTVAELLTACERPARAGSHKPQINADER